MPEGGELVLLIGSVAGVVAAVFVLADPVEAGLFGGVFQRQLVTGWGVR